MLISIIVAIVITLSIPNATVSQLFNILSITAISPSS